MAKKALKCGANLIVNSDAHSPSDFITQEFAYKIALAAGLSEEKALQVIIENPKKLLTKINR